MRAATAPHRRDNRRDDDDDKGHGRDERGDRDRDGGRGGRGVNPFIRASGLHVEPAGIDVTRQLNSTGIQDLGVFDIPAYGFLRSLVLTCTISGSTGTPVFAEDGPFSLLQNIQLTEPNGAVIGQWNTGHDLMLVNKWFGSRNVIGSDPRTNPLYTTDATGNTTFILRIPVELSEREALGALPNQNSAATFKLRMSLASSAASSAAGALYSTAPTIAGQARVVVTMEAYDQPESHFGGHRNQTNPPAMNTTQFHTTQVFNVTAGSQTIRLGRVGNYIRNIGFVFRRGGTSRANGHTDFPDPSTIYLDARPITTASRSVWLSNMYERSGFGGRAPGGSAAPALDAAGALDAGFYLYDFTHEFDGALGAENRDLWLPTIGSTRLELQGNFANAGTLTVITNDVAIADNVFI